MKILIGILLVVSGLTAIFTALVFSSALINGDGFMLLFGVFTCGVTLIAATIAMALSIEGC